MWNHFTCQCFFFLFFSSLSYGVGVLFKSLTCTSTYKAKHDYCLTSRHSNMETWIRTKQDQVAVKISLCTGRSGLFRNYVWKCMALCTLKGVQQWTWGNSCPRFKKASHFMYRQSSWQTQIVELYPHSTRTRSMELCALIQTRSVASGRCRIGDYENTAA